MITATNKHTGEVVELEADTFEQIVEAWNIAKEYEKVSDALKKQLKELVPNYVSDKGISDEYNGYMFRVSVVQRKDYDKSILRDVLDQDTFDVLTKPDKTAIDKYLKENIETLGDVATQLRKTMVDVGKPYEVIKLEKLTRG